MATNTQLGDLNSQPIPTMWHMKHWLSHHKITIHNDGTQLSFEARLSAERDGYEIDDTAMWDVEDANDGQL